MTGEPAGAARVLAWRPAPRWHLFRPPIVGPRMRILRPVRRALRSLSRDPKKGWFTILRLHSPLEPFFTKKWRPSKIELVK